MTRQGRRNAVELMEEIFKALPIDGTVSITKLSERLETTWPVADKYLKFIWRIQHGPRVIAIPEEGTNNVNWRKEYGNLPKDVKGSG